MFVLINEVSDEVCSSFRSDYISSSRIPKSSRMIRFYFVILLAEQACSFLCTTFSLFVRSVRAPMAETEAFIFLHFCRFSVLFLPIVAQGIRNGRATHADRVVDLTFAKQNEYESCDHGHGRLCHLFRIMASGFRAQSWEMNGNEWK